ncbi:MAG: heme-binding protein, partial [Blastocatellia bacterium]|nr:heme-binding protein [Blastocatellia bacterium]
DTQFKQQNNFCDATNGRSGTSLLNSTVMIFSGSSPLYKGGRLAGAVGISGDGIDQDDIIGSFGSENFEANPEIRIDRFFMRGIRIPFTKFPRHPHIGEEGD